MTNLYSRQFLSVWAGDTYACDGDWLCGGAYIADRKPIVSTGRKLGSKGFPLHLDGVMLVCRQARLALSIAVRQEVLS